MLPNSSFIMERNNNPFKNDSNIGGIKTNFIIIKCQRDAKIGAFQDLKIKPSSGVYTYNDSDDLTSNTSNRYIVWRTYDNMLELSEHSLNRDLHYNDLQIKFECSLILENGVTIHETSNKIVILVSTIVSVHRLIFPHPNQMFSNPNSVGSLSCLAPSLSTQSSDSPCFSIFYRVSFPDHGSSYYELKNSFSQNITLGSPAILPYLATCSWIDDKLDAYFILSTTNASLNIIKLKNEQPDPKIPNSNGESLTFDLRQNNLIGKFLTGLVPSIINNKQPTGTEVAISLLSYDTPDDNLIFALCRDGRIRVISLRQQNFLIVHNLFNQTSKENQIDSPVAKTTIQSTQKPASMKFWWYENETHFPNLVVYVTDSQYNRFYFYQVVIPNSNVPMKNHSMSSSFNSTANNAEPHLRYLFQRFIPSHYELIDYFVYNSQLWAMWQHNETINLQYYSIETNYESEQPFEWMPVIADVNAHPEIGLRSQLVNPREYYLNEIFWRGNFTLQTISKAIAVLNRSVGDEEFPTAKIDLLIEEAVKLVDNIIRNQAENQLEMNMDEYIQHEVDAWNKLYQFCLDYHIAENEPMSIFVDPKTGVKGIVRKARLEFIPFLSPFDDMINHYFLHCKQNYALIQQEKQQNGDVSQFRSAANQSAIMDNQDLFSICAFEYRLNTLMQPIQESSEMFSTVENMKSSILALLHGMSAINVTLKEEDLLDFEAFMQRMSSFSTKTKLSLADITKKITEDSLLPEMPSLSDNSFVPLIDDFFEKCPYVVETIRFFLWQISYDFLTKSELNEYLSLNNEMQFLLTSNNESAHLKMHDALQFEIKPMFTNLLSSRYGLEHTVTSITRIVQMRYKFCRDLFLLQYMLTSFHSKVKNDFKSKIIQEVQASMIPFTSQLLFALNHLSWICETPMITPNIWYSSNNERSLTSIIALNTISSSTSNCKGSSFENSELLTVLEMRDYINLNRVGILSHESIFFDAYPRANILYFFIQFSGGILTKRLLSYTLTCEYNQGTIDQSTISGDGIWINLIPYYMNSICQLLWPFSPGQFKLAEFLLGVGQYHLVERYVDRLQPWCNIFSYSRYFAKGVCYLMTGEGEKAIKQFKQSVLGIDTEPFLFRIFAQKPKIKDSQIEMATNETGDKSVADPLMENEHLLRKLHMQKYTMSNMNLFSNARTIFRYYNKLIRLFNNYSTPDLVIELAECALNSLKKDSDPEYDQHHSSLQSRLFTCHIRLGNTEQAYKAMLDNTDQNLKQNCLRQFIVNLCESGKYKELVSYSYIGLEDDFVSILESKARSSSIRKVGFGSSNKKCSSLANEMKTVEHINYYYILYSYFLKTFNYHRAAQAIYDYYRQLSQEFNGNEQMMRKQAEALLIARNCLKCQDDPKYWWVIKNIIQDHNEQKNQLKRKRDGYFAEQEKDYGQDKTIIEIVDVDELLREYELINARLKLLERNSKEYAIASTMLTPDETVILCISASLYEQSFKICQLFDLPLESIFEGMASKYVQLLHGTYNRCRIDDEMMMTLLANSSFDGQQPNGLDGPKLKLPIDDEKLSVEMFDVFYENTASNSECDFISYSTLSICDRMWYMIMYYLYRYESNPKVSTKYMKTVAEKLLSNGVMIPPSLLKIYKKSHCSELIRLLITYNFLPEATQLSIDYMEAFMGHGDKFFNLTEPLFPNCPPVCIPLHIFECLIKILMEEQKQQKLFDADRQWDKQQTNSSSVTGSGDYVDDGEDGSLLCVDEDGRNECMNIDYESVCAS